MTIAARAIQSAQTRCAQCATAMRCEAQTGKRCWCMDMKTLAADRLETNQGCFCPECLARRDIP